MEENNTLKNILKSVAIDGYMQDVGYYYIYSYLSQCQGVAVQDQCDMFHICTAILCRHSKTST